jgi:PAS domain-containing protein
MSPPFETLLIIGAALLSAITSYLWLRMPTAQTAQVQPVDTDTFYLFGHGILQHAPAETQAFYPLGAGFDEWFDLRDMVIDRFGQLPTKQHIHGSGKLILSANDSYEHSKITISWNDGLCRVGLLTHVEASEPQKKGEQTILQRLTSSMNDPVWHRDQDGKMQWRNKAYEKLHA